MRFDIITIFPHIFDSYFGESILKRAAEKGLIKITAHNLRDFATRKHKKARPTGRHWSFGRVDDTPYGGGPGMVMQVEPIYKAVQKLKTLPRRQAGKNLKLKTRTILFSTRGKKFDAKTAKRLSEYSQLIFICGRYEGVDERVAEHIADEEISIGDFVLSGGEIPAMVVIEAVSRFIPGVLGKYESLEEVKGSYPVYARPPIFIPKIDGRATIRTNNKKLITRIRNNKKVLSSKFLVRGHAWRVPKVLLSGNHKKIEEWRRGK